MLKVCNILFEYYFLFSTERENEFGGVKWGRDIAVTTVVKNLRTGQPHPAGITGYG
jgi:hypothetical protein